MPGAVLGPFWETPGVVLEASGDPPGWIFDDCSMFFRDGSRAKNLAENLERHPEGDPTRMKIFRKALA